MGSDGRMLLHPHLPPLESATQFQRHHRLNESECRRAVSAGTVIAVRRGLYAPASELTPEARHILLATAVARRRGPNAVLSHVSAAVLRTSRSIGTCSGMPGSTPTSGAHGRRTAGLRTFATALPVQYPIHFGGRFVASVDFAWPQFGVVGECDGIVKYGSLLSPDDTPQQVIMREKVREDLIRPAGWWTVRWGWSLAGQPELLVERIRGAFALLRPSSRAS